MKKEQIPLLPLDDLRPLVMRALEIKDWPGDWNAAGLVFERYEVESRVNQINLLYTFTVWGPKNRVNGVGIDKNPLTAIFRAVVIMRWNQAEWEKSIAK